MSTILKGVTTSIATFLQQKLPDPGAEEIDVNTLASQASEARTNLEKQKGDLKTLWQNARAVNEVYQYVAADAASLMAGQSSIHKVLASKNEHLVAQLSKLEEEAVSGLGQSLIDCSQDTSLLEKSFQDIFEILESLPGELNADPKKDYAYEQLHEQLSDMDKAAAEASEDPIKKEDTYIGRLGAFDPEDTKKKLTKLKDNIGSLYESLISISLNYQNVVPHFDKVKAMQAQLAGAIAAMEADLTAASDAAIEQATADLAALEAKQDELQQVLRVQECLKDVAGEPKKPAKTKTKAKGTTGSGTEVGQDSTTGPLADIIKEINDAKKALADHEKSKNELLENVARLKVVLGGKDAFNGKLEAHLKSLKGTKATALSLKSGVDDLKASIDGMVDVLQPLQEKMANEGSIVTSNFLSELETLSTIRGEITALNKGISQVTADGDIKVYFNEIATTLDGFPEPVKKVADNSILIEHTLADLKAWAEALQSNVGKALQEAFAKSTLSFGGEKPAKKKKGADEDDKDVASSGGEHRIDGLISDLEKQVQTDDDLEFPSGKIPVETWKDAFGKPFGSKKGSLAEWQVHFEQILKDIDTDIDVQQKKIEFLSQLSPEPAAA